MKKYLLVILLSWQQYFVWRLNFLLWRVRAIVGILISFFLWQAIFASRSEIFGYSATDMLTYIIFITFVSGVVLSTLTFRLAEEINLGRLSVWLIRPINYFRYMFARDLADKSINVFFSVLEMILLVLLLKPPIFIQTNINSWLLFILACLSAAFLYFEIGMLLSFIGFWSRETWAPQFIFSILVTFLAGTYFPLDILPTPFYNLLQLLPFTYLIFFPLKIYLGEVDTVFILKGFLIMSVWIPFFLYLVKFLWRKGLKVYTAEGQ